MEKLAAIIAALKFYLRYEGKVERTIKVTVGDQSYLIEIEEYSEPEVKLKIDGEPFKAVLEQNSISLSCEVPERIAVKERVKVEHEEVVLEEGDVLVKAHASGKVVELRIREGDEVEKGSVLLVLEAMKMELELNSPIKGVVKRIFIKEGDEVRIGDPLLIIRGIEGE